MRKTIRAKKPYIYLNNSNFKLATWEECVKAGFLSTGNRPMEKYYESLSYHLHLPTLHTSQKEARLCFCEGASLRFDTFPDYLFYEIIPVIWDCWPKFWETMEEFFLKHNVRTAFFTSSQTAEHFKSVFPECNIIHMPEGIDSHIYIQGKPLRERSIDYLEYGRCCSIVDSAKFDDSINVLSSRNERNGLATREDLVNALADSKITIAMTRLDNQPEIAEGIDTLTQRYWECMLSGIILLGRAPQELIDFIGYDPTVKIDLDNVNLQIRDILCHIEDYQDLVDRNRTIALQKGDWADRINTIMQQLTLLGYKI